MRYLTFVTDICSWSSVGKYDQAPDRKDLSLEDWVDSVIRACGKPVVLAGGSRITDEELLNRMQQARDEGGVGCSVGRNVFQHQNPQAMVAAISRVFRDKWPAKQALEELKSKLVKS
jgi:DhnA family fructose-bisphosphate aldolase class Ia